jgi:hypothetical protein
LGSNWVSPRGGKIAIIAKDANQLLAAGYQRFGAVETSGQFNVYVPIRDELTPLIIARTSSGYFGYAIIKYYAVIQVTAFNPLIIEGVSGFPNRYKFGSFQWLQGSARVIGPRQFIDAQRWSEDKTRCSFIVPFNVIANSFPPVTPPTTITYNRFLVLSETNTAGIQDFTGGIYADGFSYDLEPSVTADIAVLYRAEFAEISLPAGNTIYFVNI